MASSIEIAGGGELIRPPNTLAKRIGPRLRVFTLALLKQAEAALERISTRFAGWLQDEIAALDKRRAAIQSDGLSDAGLRALDRSARDLRSCGATFGYPLASRVAASLCDLLERTGDKPMLLIDGHIDAIRAVVRDDIRGASDPRALATCMALEEEVARLP